MMEGGMGGRLLLLFVAGLATAGADAVGSWLTRGGARQGADSIAFAPAVTCRDVVLRNGPGATSPRRAGPVGPTMVLDKFVKGVSNSFADIFDKNAGMKDVDALKTVGTHLSLPPCLTERALRLLLFPNNCDCTCRHRHTSHEHDLPMHKETDSLTH